jgi:quinoprotein glucose dehydrogenase
MRILIYAALVFGAAAMQCQAGEPGWSHYGGGLDGARYAESAVITPANVQRLSPAWTFRTGDATNGEGYFGDPSSFKATPILFDGKLIFSTGFNRVFAVDPKSGKELWRFDPQVDFTIGYSEMFTSRGVAAWRDEKVAAGEPCAGRVFLGTLDARLIAIDSATGEPCAAFGRKGDVDLSKGIKRFRRGEYSETSPPTVVNGVVVVGSSIGDNGGAKLDEGKVRGFDARTGALRWEFDPIPRSKKSPGWETWENASGKKTGAANVWTIMAADAERDLVFLPTTSPSPDFFGGERLGDNAFANSIVALRATTGEFVWAYQLVHHDLWDYDSASQPMLIDATIKGAIVPLLVQATKMGFVFVLNRETGEPFLPVEEQRVPPSDVAGERAAETQRFPSIRLHPTDATSVKLWDYSDEHSKVCKRLLKGVRYEGIFTPPSLEGSLVFPGNPGGTNWGSMAADTTRGLAFLVVNQLPTVVQLIPRKDFEALDEDGTMRGVEAEYTSQSGTPYGMGRFELYNPENKLPCLEGPWGSLFALNIETGAVVWRAPLGAAPGLENHPQASQWGFLGGGGPIALAGGVVFAATPYDKRLYAYDMRDGRVLWKADLPAGAHATPMSYEIDGEQYVVLAAGGNLREGEGRGDLLVAFKLASANARH